MEGNRLEYGGLQLGTTTGIVVVVALSVWGHTLAVAFAPAARPMRVPSLYSFPLLSLSLG
jgi:hypothetical protein